MFVLILMKTNYNQRYKNWSVYLREVAKTMLLSARGNEIIFEFTDVMQLDIFMLRFNIK